MQRGVHSSYFLSRRDRPKGRCCRHGESINTLVRALGQSTSCHVRTRTGPNKELAEGVSWRSHRPGRRFPLRFQLAHAFCASSWAALRGHLCSRSRHASFAEAPVIAAHVPCAKTLYNHHFTAKFQFSLSVRAFLSTSARARARRIDAEGQAR